MDINLENKNIQEQIFSITQGNGGFYLCIYRFIFKRTWGPHFSFFFLFRREYRPSPFPRGESRGGPLDTNPAELIALSNFLYYIAYYVCDIIAQGSQEKQKTVVYAHNGGRFDYYFLMSMLLFLKIKKKNKTLKVIYRNSRLLQIALPNRLSFRDSYPLIYFPLKKIGKIFLNREKGDIMSNKIGIETFFQKMKDKKFNSEFINYQKEDCTILLDSLLLINDIIKKSFGIIITDALTISSLARTLFYSKYYGKKKYITITSEQLKKEYNFNDKQEAVVEYYIPIVNNSNESFYIINNDPITDFKIREAYKGGRCEVYIPTNTNSFSPDFPPFSSVFPP